MRGASWNFFTSKSLRPKNRLRRMRTGALFEAVLEMKEKEAAAPMKVRRHYTETVKAFNRMRQNNTRPPVRIRARKTSGRVAT